MKTSLRLMIAVLAAGTLKAQIPNYVPTSSLQAWYSFNGNANDLSGNNNNGTVVNGAALTNDKNNIPNSAYSFDGVDDYIIVNGSPTFINDSMTISFWINAPQNFPNDLIELGSNSSVIWGVTASTDWVEMAVGRGCSGGGTSYTQTAICSLNMWHHFALVLSKSTHKLYKNGMYVGTCTKSQMSTLSCSSQSLYIGSAIFTSQSFFNGKLDDIGIWNRALTPCEISQLFSASQSTITAVSSSSVICVSQSATLTASGASTYTWNPGNLTGSAIVVSPSITTTYSVAGTNTINSCNATSSVVQNVSACTDLVEQNINSILNVHPNPTAGSFFVSASKSLDLEIRDRLGRLISEVEVRENTPQAIENLGAGIYFITAKNNSFAPKKIIITK